LYDKFLTLDNYNNIKVDFDVYLSMTRYCDYTSFIRVYNLFLIMIEKKLKQEEYLKFVEIFLLILIGMLVEQDIIILSFKNY